MQHKRSIQFYELLRQMSFDRYKVGSNLYTYGWGIKALKEMFDIPKDGKGSYMRAKGGFDRFNFEKYVIDPLCEDLMNCKMIHLVIQPDGKPYVKMKKGKSVQGYQFYWTMSQHPAVASASEVKELQDRVDRDPQILKIASDLLAGEKKKQKKSESKLMMERSYDFAELEKEILKAQKLKESD